MAQRRKTGGRTAGTLNKATAEVKALAKSYTAEVVEILINVARTADSDAAKVAACRELLDRGHGKSVQAIVGEDSLPLVQQIDVYELARRTAFLLSLPNAAEPITIEQKTSRRDILRGI